MTRIPVALTLVVAAVGCGRPLADADYAPSYGTNQGTVTSAESIPGAVRAGLAPDDDHAGAWHAPRLAGLTLGTRHEEVTR
ncbi:MAG TPA: hypothetical protein VGQ83_42735 [Polyangia bacterium]